MGGQAALQGVPERAPVRITVPQVWLHASSEAAVAALIAHACMLRTGEGAVRRRLRPDRHGLVDDAGDGGARHPGPRLQPRWAPSCSSARYPSRSCYECADGHVVALPNGATIAEDGALDGGRWRRAGGVDQPARSGAPTTSACFRASRSTIRWRRRLDAPCARYLKRHTKDELMERGLREGVTIAPVNTVADLLALPATRGARVLAGGAAAQRDQGPGAGLPRAAVGRADDRAPLGPANRGAQRRRARSGGCNGPCAGSPRPRQ